jgi:hypothetical protein
MRRRKKRKRLGGRVSPIGGSLRPVTGAGSGGRSSIAWGGCEGARRQAIDNRGGAGCGGAGARPEGARGGCAHARGRARARGGDGWRCGGDRAGRARIVGWDLEEEEARLLLFEVRDLSFERLRA